MGTFDKYEMSTLHSSSIADKIGENKRLFLHDSPEFKDRQFTVKVWKTTVDKNWTCDNLKLEVVNTDHIWRRASALYSLFMQLSEHTQKFAEPITIFRRNEKYYVETGLQRYTLNKILSSIELEAYIVDTDAVCTNTSDITQHFHKAEIVNNLDIRLEQSNDWQNGEACYQYVLTPKFMNDELANEHSTLRLEFASLINNFGNSLTFWYKDCIVGKMSNGKSMLNIQIDSLEGLAQFILEYFCDYNDFCIERQYRIIK